MKLFTNNLKIIVVSLALLLIVAYTVNSTAQSKEPPKKTIDVICVTEQQIEDTLIEKYKERPMLVMTTSREINGKPTTVSTVLFVNPKTRSWTLAEKWGENNYCVIGMGEGITPYVDSGKPV